MKDIHFEYNGGDIAPEELPTLREDATLLSDFLGLDPKASVTVEGHCDARGSDEYNVALGDRRASSVKSALVNLGVPDARLFAVSYGKEHSLCDETTEQCYARNRRVHFSVTRGERMLESRTPP